MKGIDKMPAMETVLTMCASLPAASMRGTNARTPFRLTPQVDAERPFEVGRRAFPHQAAREHSGVVAQDVDPAVRLVRVLGERFHVVVLRHVGEERARSADRRRGLSEGAGLDVRRDHAHAFTDEALRECPTDPTACARDHRDLALELFHAGMVAKDLSRERTRG